MLLQRKQESYFPLQSIFFPGIYFGITEACQKYRGVFLGGDQQSAILYLLLCICVFAFAHLPCQKNVEVWGPASSSGAFSARGKQSATLYLCICVFAHLPRQKMLKCGGLPAPVEAGTTRRRLREAGGGSPHYQHLVPTTRPVQPATEPRAIRCHHETFAKSAFEEERRIFVTLSPAMSMEGG